jgi:hypothetical protein
MKIASVKKANPSIAKANPNTSPHCSMNRGQRSPSSNDRIVPVTTPIANRMSITFDQRFASALYAGLPVRWCSHSTKSTMAGKEIPKQTSGMCTPNESACICRASVRYSWEAASLAWASTAIQPSRLDIPATVAALT